MVDPEDSDHPPTRSDGPAPHYSAGRYLTAHRYVVGWPEHGLVKIGCSTNPARVKRFTRTKGAELIDVAHYARLYDDVRSECWLASRVERKWPRAWARKDESTFLLGRNTGGWTEFYAVPVEDWTELRELAAL